MEGLTHLSFVENENTVANALSRLKSPAVFRTLKLCDKLVGNADLFYSLGRAFRETISDEEVHESIAEAARFGLTVSVENLRDAYMQCLPNKGLDVNNTTPHSIILNDKYLSYNLNDETQCRRCTFLVLVKALHEYAHTLTPSFARRTEAFAQSGAEADLNTPEKLGSIWRNQKSVAGDAGRAWETFTFGGRVLTASTTGNFYAKPLQLVIIGDAAAANSSRADIDDERITTLLEELEKWNKDMKIPDLSLLGFLANEDDEGPPRKIMRKSASVSGGLHIMEHDFFDASLQQSTTSSASGHVSSGGEADAAPTDVPTREPRSTVAPVPLSDEEYEELVKVGQAMSPEMQRAWMTGNVKF